MLSRDYLMDRVHGQDWAGYDRGIDGVVKGTDLSVYSQAELNKVAPQLNERPRKTLEFETPAEKFNACVASTG